jgi:hypothetical protein
MPINTVNNNAPAQSVAISIDKSVNVLNTPAPTAPPGSTGHQGQYPSQLYAGNPGGVGAGFGLGAALDTAS